MRKTAEACSAKGKGAAVAKCSGHRPTRYAMRRLVK